MKPAGDSGWKSSNKNDDPSSVPAETADVAAPASWWEQGFPAL